MTTGPSSNTFSTAVITNVAVAMLGVLRLDAESIKTGDYTITTTDAIIIANGTSLTLTLPPTPAADQVLFIRNINATTCTVARNGNNIDGAAANLTLAALTGATILYFEPTMGWVQLSVS